MSKAATSTDYDDYIHEPNNENLDHIPGEYGLPFIGKTFEFLKDPFTYAMGCYKKYGPVFRTSFGGVKSVVVVGPDLVQRVMLDPGRDFSSKMGFMERVTTFFDGSLIMEDFEHHRYQRRIVQSAFKNDALKYYTEEINRIYRDTMKSWEADEGKTIPFFEYIKNTLLQVANEIFLGEKDDPEQIKKLNKAFIGCAGGQLYFLPIYLPGFRYYKGLKGKRYLKNHFMGLVGEKRAGEGKDMFSHFCREKDEDGNFFTDEEVVNQIHFLLFAAHDTTTSAITHTIFYLARNPDMKQKLYEECLSIGKDKLDYEDLDKVPYMQMVFNEVQRIRPSVPLLPRRTIREVEMAGVTIPAHTMLYTMPRSTHWMEEYWDEPEKFDPERFSPERAEHKKHAFQFHPFGGGAHKCIGMHFSQMEYKCFLYQFMLKFDFEAKHKKDDVYMMSFPLPKPSDDMPIKLTRR